VRLLPLHDGYYPVEQEVNLKLLRQWAVELMRFENGLDYLQKVPARVLLSFLEAENSSCEDSILRHVNYDLD
jgi:hypothetical protein